MKRLILILGVLIIMVPALCQATAPPVCSPANTINLIIFPQSMWLSKIQDEITKYNTHPEGDHYEVCFQMDELPLFGSSWNNPLAVKADNSNTKDIYIVGVKLKVDENDPVKSELFIVKSESSGKVILKDFEFKKVKKGILLHGKASEIRSSIIEGDDSGADACIDVSSKGSVLDDVEISKCKEGVLVQADNVVINKSTIWDNKIGVKITSAVEGTDIISSRIYANNDGLETTPIRDDGVRIEGGVAHATVFYDKVGDEYLPVSGEDEVKYEDRTAYILVPLPPGETKPAKMEFYLSDKEDCGLPISLVANEQPCGLIEVSGLPMRVDIDSAELEKGPVSVEIPPAFRDKSLVTMYSDPELGTAGVSRQFSFAEASGGVVAFVTTPYDIPGTGASDVEIASGVEDEGVDTVDDEGSGMAGETEVVGGGAIEGTGSGIASAGGCGGGGSLTRDSFLNLHVGLNLWWILLIAGLGIGAKLVRVHAKRDTREK